jgi:hypothetical protein
MSTQTACRRLGCSVRRSRTLLQTLSDPEMLAIASSTRPLG